MDVRRGRLLNRGKKKNLIKKKNTISRNPTDILLIRDSFKLEGTERTRPCHRSWISSFINIIQQD